jgi:biopolymer transport protein TolR
MARNFRRARTAQPIAELNVTNLIDLGFMLLIIFMVATPLINQNEQSLRVDLPVESRSEQTKPDPDERFESVVIKADGTLAFGGRTMTLAQFARELPAIAAQPRPPVFRIRADAKATAQHYIAVLDELKKNRLFKIAMDTQTAPR